MSLTIKILLTGTFLLMVMKTWISAISIATVDVLASKSGRITSAQEAKIADETGKATLKAIGLSIWLTAMSALLWIFL